jgi:hypothetical protein
MIGGEWYLVVKNCGGTAVAFNFDGTGCYGFEVVSNQNIPMLYSSETMVLKNCQNHHWKEPIGTTVQCADPCVQVYPYCDKTPVPMGVIKPIVRDHRVTDMTVGKAILDAQDQSDYPLLALVLMHVKQEWRWKETEDTPGDGDLLDTWYFTLSFSFRINRDPEATEPYELTDYSVSKVGNPSVTYLGINFVRKCDTGEEP